MDEIEELGASGEIIGDAIATETSEFVLKVMQNMFNADADFKVNEAFDFNNKAHREYALAFIKKYNGVEGLDTTVGYKAMTYYDRLASRVVLPEVKFRDTVLGCFTIACQKSGKTFNLENFLVKYNFSVKAQKVRSIQDYIARYLDWELGCPVFDFLEYYILGIGTTFVDEKLIKQIIIDSIQFMQLASFSPSVMAGAAIRLTISADAKNVAIRGMQHSAVDGFFSDDGACGRFAPGLRDEIRKCEMEMQKLYMVDERFRRIVEAEDDISEVGSRIGVQDDEREVEVLKWVAHLEEKPKAKGLKKLMEKLKKI